MRWTLAVELTRGTVLESMVGLDLFESIWIAIIKHRRCPAQLILLVEILQVTWTERSLAAYQKMNLTFPIDHVIRHTLLQVEALEDITIKPLKWRVLERSREVLRTLLARYVRQLGV